MNPDDFLHRILEQKQAETARAAENVPERTLRCRAESRLRTDRRPFRETLMHPGAEGVNIIAEIKRASPSKGTIREDLDPAAYAAAYENGGAAALSVLTDSRFFHGQPHDLKRARAATALPVLRKDFILSTYQIYESADMGADAVLLIVRALPEALMKDALALCDALGLDALVEVHSEEELETATRAGARLVGINNRDLSTFRTNVRHSIRIGRHLDSGQVAVSESGIRTREDIEMLTAAGIHNFLIGESLVRADRPERLLARLMGLQPAGKRIRGAR